jgi:hypothetical protein
VKLPLRFLLPAIGFAVLVGFSSWACSGIPARSRRH